MEYMYSMCIRPYSTEHNMLFDGGHDTSRVVKVTMPENYACEFNTDRNHTGKKDNTMWTKEPAAPPQVKTTHG